MNMNQSLRGFNSALMSSLALFSKRNQSNYFIILVSCIGCLKFAKGSHGFGVLTFFFAGAFFNGDLVVVFCFTVHQITFDQNMSCVN